MLVYACISSVRCLVFKPFFAALVQHRASLCNGRHSVGGAGSGLRVYTTNRYP